MASGYHAFKKVEGPVRKLFIILTIILAGCSQSQWNDKLSTKEDRALATNFIAGLMSGNVDGVRSQIDPKLYAYTKQIEGKVKAIMPAAGEPELVSVGVSSMSEGGQRATTKAMNYELGSGGKWVAVQIILQQASRSEQIVGWHAVPSAVRPTAAGDFSFAGRGAIHYIWLAAMAIVFATGLVAAFLAFRSKGIRYRWFWIIGSLLGFVQFTLNWSSGQWGVRPFAFMLFSISALKPSPFDAWLLSFCIPIVGIVFLTMRPRLIRKGQERKAQQREQAFE
ncbi:hypothetical protein KRR38_12870 [Novosphingobium sp. G106]|uniref:hypothetical protein n=1 Tax=Novosphingobium sp. G106 TaxID=2849500 RepID=UPI001C2CCF47|nr:hypothetical protein [Novosphingobium sp. G106]MBV1688543.1 hypothetical protein [Novosphingobium sp. G106]